MQQLQPHNLLKQVSRPWEILVGWTCALISAAFAALLVYLVYIVGWRNPRQYGSHDLLTFPTLAVFALLLLIAVGFSVFASRLLLKGKSRRRLMSPVMLRAWGTFFSLGSAVMVIDCAVHRRWSELPHLWELLSFSVSMAVAAFILARKSQHNEPLT